MLYVRGPATMIEVRQSGPLTQIPNKLNTIIIVDSAIQYRSKVPGDASLSVTLKFKQCLKSTSTLNICWCYRVKIMHERFVCQCRRIHNRCMRIG